MIWYKQGVWGDLEYNTSDALRLIERLYDAYGKNVFVTSKRDGTHMAGSFHPHGRAFDIRKEGIEAQVIRKWIGNKFDVVEHDTHYHIEYDPKEG